MTYEHDGEVLAATAKQLADRFEGILPAHRTLRRRAPPGHHTEGAIVSDIPEVLVVCTHNAGRSVAARILLEHYGHGRITVRSAGSSPGADINPAMAQVLTERRLDVSKEFPKPLTDEAVCAADLIITMGCGDACPVYPGKRYLDWDLPDPAGKSVDEVLPIVDEVDRCARALVMELTGDSSSAQSERS